jgi:hypothetical protein
MDVSQMERRCPKAKPLSILTLPNYRLVFRGVADIIPAHGMSVDGVLWAITPECELALDRYEGYRYDQPKGGMYRKEVFKLKLPSGPREVMFYAMNRGEFTLPYGAYGDCIHRAYQTWGLNMDKFDAAIDHAEKFENARRPSRFDFDFELPASSRSRKRSVMEYRL